MLLSEIRNDERTKMSRKGNEMFTAYIQLKAQTEISLAPVSERNWCDDFSCKNVISSRIDADKYRSKAI